MNARFGRQVIPDVKSVLIPSQEVEFLGFILNSIHMTVALPLCRKDSIRRQGLTLLCHEVVSLHDLASFIGLTVAADPAVELAPLRYKYLEIIRNNALTRSHGDYSASIYLDSHARDLIHWWVQNIDCQIKSLRPSSPQLELYADASLTGWGASMGTVQTGGHSAQEELDHINVLELKAILMGLSSLCKDHRDIHVRLRSDNIATVVGLGRVGSIKPRLHAVIEEIFTWAESRGITLSAEHVKGLHNAEADFESRVRNLDAEWMLHPEIFKLVCSNFFTPDIDLFATRINAQLPVYVSWRPDPTSTYVNAFSIPWSTGNLYAFPPFSVICRVLEKIQVEAATVLAILPLWPTQVWFPRALQLLAAPPLLLPPNPIFLPQDPSLSHPQGRRLVLTVMQLSGIPSAVRAFRQRLPTFSFSHGGPAQSFNMGHISKDGCFFVAKGKLIHFTHL